MQIFRSRLSCFISRMLKKAEKPCSHMRWALRILPCIPSTDSNLFFIGLQNGENMDIGYDYEKCIGLKVKPRKGDGLLFYSLMVNGTIDPVCSCHSSCSWLPILWKDSKWATYVVAKSKILVNRDSYSICTGC